MGEVIYFPLPGVAAIAVDHDDDGLFTVEVWDWPALAYLACAFDDADAAVTYADCLSETHRLPLMICCELPSVEEVRHA